MILPELEADLLQHAVNKAKAVDISQTPHDRLSRITEAMRFWNKQMTTEERSVVRKVHDCTSVSAITDWFFGVHNI